MTAVKEGSNKEEKSHYVKDFFKHVLLVSNVNYKIDPDQRYHLLMN